MTAVQNPTELKLSDKQRAALPLLLAAPSVAEGCRKAGISRDTFYVWYNTPAFHEEFKRQRAASVDEALGALKAALADAVETLRGLLRAKGRKGEPTRLRAAQTVIENVLKAVEMETLEERLAALERSVTR
jgi:hypothetical protein